MFTDKAMNVIKDLDSIHLEVSSDYYIFEATNKEKLSLNDNIKITLVETVPIEPLFDFLDGNELYDSGLLGEFENYINSIFSDSFDYQIGGNPLNSIQGEYSNLIGYYYGEYGDCGALYVYANKDSLDYSVDMH